MVVPLTCTWPEVINSSALRREAIPAAAIIFCRRSAGMMNSNASVSDRGAFEPLSPAHGAGTVSATALKLNALRWLPLSGLLFCRLFFLFLGNAHFPRTDVLFNDLWLHIDGALCWNQLSLQRLGHQL